MQTILGSGGPIGIELAKALTEYTDKIRLVSRQPERVNRLDELVSADLLNNDQLKNAIKGSKIVYVTIGFPYKYSVWEESWPKFIKNLIEACIQEQCKLVFFDNIYMYDENHLNGMTEHTPINPPSKKGKIRSTVAEMILNEFEKGNLKALIARCADFYGPHVGNSFLNEAVFKLLKDGKTANWLGKDNCKHSFTYTVDAGKATALLGNTEKAYGHVWHLPTASNPYTGKEWVQTIADEFGVKPKYRVASKFMIKGLGLFNPFMRETVEMIYQYDRDYVFDSSKFEKEFDFLPTSYISGIKNVVNSMK